MISMLETLLLIVTLLSAALHHGSSQTEVPGAPANLQLVFMEDTRLNFLQHAVLDFSWTPPENEELLLEYELVIEHVPPNNLNSRRHSCGMTQDTVNVSLQANLTAYRLRAVDGLFTSLPIYTCKYTAMLVSKPGNLSSDPLQFTVEYGSPMQSPVPRQALQLECTAHYDPETVMYTVNVTWDLTDQHPLVKEALLVHPFYVEAYRVLVNLRNDVNPDNNVFFHQPQLVSKPGNLSSDPLQFTVEYDSPMQSPVPRQALQLECTAHYDPETVMYTVNVTVDLTDQHPLVKEALLVHPFYVVAQRVLVNLRNDVNSENNVFFHQPQENVTEVTALILPPYDHDFVVTEVHTPIPSSNNDAFYWRSSVFPGSSQCPRLTLIPPVQPSQVLRESIRINIDTSFNKIMVFWEPPVYPNGDLIRYEVCVGEVELEAEEECDSLNHEIQLNDLVTPDMLSFDASSQILPGSELTIQIRAVNEYGRLGNWSEAIIITRPTVIEPTISGSPDPPPSSPGLPALVYGVIAVAIVVVLVVLLVIGTVFVLRRYDIHPCSSVKRGASVPVSRPHQSTKKTTNHYNIYA